MFNNVDYCESDSDDLCGSMYYNVKSSQENAQGTQREEEVDRDSWWLTSLKPVRPYVCSNQFSMSLLTPKMEADRVNFAKEHEHFTWDSVMFADEHCIRVGRFKIVMWAAISKHGITDLKILGHRLTGLMYIEQILTPIIKPYQLEHPHMIYVHDNAPSHSSSAVKTWLNENRIQVLKWPICSSDLNLMENLWSLLSLHLEDSNNIQPTSYQESVALVKHAWRKLKDQYRYNFIAELYRSMRQRMKLCIQKEGK